MPKTRTCSCVLILALAGCTRIPDSYAPPIQRKSAEEVTNGLSYYIQMDMPNATDHLVSDVLPELEGGHWRWALKNPVLRFRIPRTNGLKLRVDWSVVEDTFKDTGPVTVKFFVEDHLLGEQRADKPENFVFEKPVPEAWLTTDRPVLVKMELDKLWTSPTDGAKRGFILTKLGFVE